MNLVEIYAEKMRGLPVTHKQYPFSKDIHEAAMVFVRFPITPGYSMYYISKNRFGQNGTVCTKEGAEYFIKELTEKCYKYIMIDASVLRRADYLMIKASVIRYMEELQNPIRGSRSDLIYYDDAWR